jgi:uncharacterized protein involved in response to NO
LTAPADLLAAAPTWRREPYRVLFPLGVLLAWAGIGHWLLIAVFEVGAYNGVFHSIAQIEGFMMAFGTGFLFTALPRRTRSAPPAAWEMGLACLAPVATTISAWAGAIALAQVFWGSLVLMLIAFAGRRLIGRAAGRRAPNCFVWIPLALLTATLGAGLIGAQRGLGRDYWWLHGLGQDLILQGLFLGLIVGVGGMVLPLLTRGDPPPDGTDAPRDRWIRVGHAAAALALIGTFVLESRVSPAAGYAARSLLVLALLVGVTRVWRPPTLPGWHRWLIWISAWCLPAGYGLAALTPAYEQAGLHVVFVGGFALMALSVGLHVSLAHGGYQRTVRSRPWQVPVMGVLVLVAVAARAAMAYAPTHVWTLMGVASASFLLATVAWMHLLLPRMWRPAPPDEAFTPESQT